jgi:putative glutamine amidotransferase
MNLPTAAPLKIGVSACFFHADDKRPIFTGKTLQYIEQSVAHWVMSQGDLAVMIPAPDETQRLAEYAQWLDGLVLMGGSDVWPGSYGEQALDPRWNGDRIRDAYEMALARAFVAAGKPVFGVCRGLQLLNVAFGGTLLQDIPTLKPEALTHRDPGLYDQLYHPLQIEPGSRLAQLYDGRLQATVNSVHHQAIKDLAPDLRVEARCPVDGMIEAVRLQGPAWVAAVQWHPEFHHSTVRGIQAPPEGLIDDAPLLADFRAACQAARALPN